MSDTYNLHPVDTVPIVIGATGVIEKNPSKLHQVILLQIDVVAAEN